METKKTAQVMENELADEQVKDRLLVEMHAFSHGSWAHLNMNRVALFGKNLKHALSSPQRERFQDTIKTYLEKTVPALAHLTEKPWSSVFTSDAILALELHARELARILQGESFSPIMPNERLSLLQREIPKHADDILHALRMMKEQLFAHFQCDPIGIIQQLLESHKDAIAQNGIVVEKQFSPVEPKVSISAAELSLVIDLMIRQAIRSVKHQEKRRLSFGAITHLDRWHLEITHSGVGLPADQWLNVFEPSLEQPPGINYQLNAIPLILQKFEGDVCVKRSDPTSGTTFLIRLKVAQP